MQTTEGADGETAEGVSFLVLKRLKSCFGKWRASIEKLVPC